MEKLQQTALKKQMIYSAWVPSHAWMKTLTVVFTNCKV